MFKKAARRGRSERGGEAYSSLYVEPLSDARTKLGAFFNILLVLQKIKMVRGAFTVADRQTVADGFRQIGLGGLHRVGQ
jgi:hypothetical protein